MTRGRGRGRGQPSCTVPPSPVVSAAVTKNLGDSDQVDHVEVTEISDSQDEISQSDEEEVKELNHEALNSPVNDRIESY
ncbi:unnamed protein product [Lathyrus sativus]|nr:unnamed protein product [Lathyrus sativus]